MKGSSNPEVVPGDENGRPGDITSALRDYDVDLLSRALIFFMAIAAHMTLGN